MDKNKYALITLPTPTFAMAAAELLSRKGISARAVKVDALRGKGCGNGVELEKRYLLSARDILTRNNFPITETV